jgi:hypothetical protein
MMPALTKTTPSVTPEEHAQLGQGVDELERHFRRLVSPDELREYAESTKREGGGNTEDDAQRGATTQTVEPTALGTAAEPGKNKKRRGQPAGTDAQDDRSDPSLSEDQRYLLVAALELAVFESDSRRTAAQIVDRAKGRFADPFNAKKALANLVHKGLLGSQTGAQGGYWLTLEGRHRAERLVELQKGDAERR